MTKQLNKEVGYRQGRGVLSIRFLDIWIHGSVQQAAYNKMANDVWTVVFAGSCQAVQTLREAGRAIFND